MTVSLFGNRVFADDQVKNRSYWSRVGLTPMAGILVRRGNSGHRHTQWEACPGKMKAEKEVMQLHISYGAKEHEDGRGERILPWSPWRQHGPDLGLLVSRTGKEYISFILSCSVCGILLWQPQEMNTAHMRFSASESESLLKPQSMCRCVVLGYPFGPGLYPGEEM